MHQDADVPHVREDGASDNSAPIVIAQQNNDLGRLDNNTRRKSQ
jgi:hypothetical protein